ncbi:MAG: FAD-dependent oxidoreductase [Spirochaetota bacterium]
MREITAKSRYPNLFSEARIGPVTIPNRVVMPAMGTVLCAADGEVTDHQIAYYEERAAGGTGLIVTEIVAVEPELGKAVVNQTRADEDRFVPLLSRLVQAVHRHPTRIFAQLHHAGNQSNSRVCRGKQIVAPSEITNQGVGEKPRALTHEEVGDLVNRFASAAVRCRSAGFDGVELHAAHGYLINQFMSPHSNQRDDEYGGSFDNRMRFVTEILHSIKKQCGEEFPVMVRFSADEFVDGGITLEDSKRIARHLQDAGADALDVSCGTYESMQTLLEPITYDQGWRVYLAEAIKAEVEIPVVAVGVLRQPEFVEQVLADGRADFIALGRELLAEPDWVVKTSEGREDELRHCIQCLYCIESIFAARPIACAVNARTGHESELREFADEGTNRTVAIVGGGPAGVEAARVLSLRGFRPIVYERRSQLGGQLVPGCVPPKKEEIAWYRDYLNRQMEILGIDVRLGTEATPELVRQDDPYAVILAIGAESRVPGSIEGIAADHVVTAERVLEDGARMENAATAVVVGAGLTGCETADLLAQNGVAVTIVEMLPEIATETHPINRVAVQERLSDAGVQVLTRRELVRVHKGGIEISDAENNTTEEVAADWVVLGLGLETAAENRIRPWKEAFDRTIVVGDAVEPRRVAQAVREGFDAAYVLR